MAPAPWDSFRFRPARRAHVVELGDRAALFDEKKQILRELNQTALNIWKQLCAGETCTQVAAVLHAAGASREEARAFANGAASEWLQLGLIVPEDVELARSEAPHAALALAVDGRTYELRFFGDASAEEARQVFGHFESDNRTDATRIDLVGKWGRNFLFCKDEPIGMFTPRQTTPRVKALMAGDPIISRLEGFLVHGAILSANGKRVLLAGGSGAGKSTLALALVSEGFAYGGDDVARVYPDGTVCGVPFAATVMPGAWPLLRGYMPELESLPILERRSGTPTRYVPVKNLDNIGRAPIDITLALKRENGAEPRLEEVQPIDAFVAFLDSGWSGRRSTEAATLLAVARRFSLARHYRLIYGELAAAVAVVQALVRT